jgi:hypothetical protein
MTSTSTNTDNNKPYSCSSEVLSLSSHEDDDDDDSSSCSNDDDDDHDNDNDDAHDENTTKLIKQTDDTTTIDTNTNTNNTKTATAKATVSTIKTTTIHNSISKRIENFITLYCKFANNPNNTDRGIKIVQWTLWLISQITKNDSRYNKHLSPSLRKFYSDLSLMRYVLRLYGLPPALDAAVFKPGSWAGAPPYEYSYNNNNNDDNDKNDNAHNNKSWKDGRITKLSKIMAWSMVIYHPLEHIAYFNWIMPKLLHKINGNKFSAWSCRCWLLYIVSDGISSFLKNCELGKHKQYLLQQHNSSHDHGGDHSGDCGDGNGNDKMIHDICATIDKSMKMNKLQMARCFFFIPPCMSWSTDNWATDPLFSENVVNGMSWIEAVICMYQTIISL